MGELSGQLLWRAVATDAKHRRPLVGWREGLWIDASIFQHLRDTEQGRYELVMHVSNKKEAL